jgi:hypothetical protein
MPKPGPGKRLTLIVGENDRWQHHRLSDEILRRVRDAGLAGATVERGIEGYGRAGRLHTSRILDLSQDLPLAIVIVDSADRVTAFLAELSELIGEGTAVLDDVEIVGSGPPEAAGDADGATRPGE